MSPTHTRPPAGAQVGDMDASFWINSMTRPTRVFSLTDLGFASSKMISETHFYHFYHSRSPPNSPTWMSNHEAMTESKVGRPATSRTPRAILVAADLGGILCRTHPSFSGEVITPSGRSVSDNKCALHPLDGSEGERPG